MFGCYFLKKMLQGIRNQLSCPRSFERRSSKGLSQNNVDSLFDRRHKIGALDEAAMQSLRN